MVGALDVIRGCMFSGKTEMLCRTVENYKSWGMNYLAFKPQTDNRYSEDRIVSHNNISIPALSVKHPRDIVDCVKSAKEKISVIAIDEAQFFLTSEIIDCVESLVSGGYHIIVAGLDTDYRGMPFSFIGELLAIADNDIHLTAVCAVCGRIATRTQLLINKKPAPDKGLLILVGASGPFGVEGVEYEYQARCRACHQVATSLTCE